MSDNAELAAKLTTCLNLQTVPVSVSFADEPTEGVGEFEGAVAAGCRFWQEGTQQSISTTSRHHELCSIGVHTHNLAAPSPQQASELGEALKVMGQLNYVTDEEVAAIPVLRDSAKYVVYAPLSECIGEPDAALVFAHSQQSLIVTEAAARAQNGIPAAMGRPACAAIPQAINSGQAVLSLGCCGARAYLDIMTDDIAMWVFPGARLAQIVDQIEIMSKANTTLERFHELRRQDVEAGGSPTIQDSLQRLS